MVSVQSGIWLLYLDGRMERRPFKGQWQLSTVFVPRPKKALGLLPEDPCVPYWALPNTDREFRMEKWSGPSQLAQSFLDRTDAQLLGIPADDLWATACMLREVA